MSCYCKYPVALPHVASLRLWYFLIFFTYSLFAYKMLGVDLNTKNQTGVPMSAWAVKGAFCTISTDILCVCPKMQKMAAKVLSDGLGANGK